MEIGKNEGGQRQSKEFLREGGGGGVCNLDKFLSLSKVVRKSRQKNVCVCMCVSVKGVDVCT